MEFLTTSRSHGAGRLHGCFYPLQHGARFAKEHATRFRQAHRFGTSLKEWEAKLLFQIADLPAQTWLRDVQLQSSPGDVFRLGHGDEVTKMAEFHASASMLRSYAEARNLVFLNSTV